MCSRNERGSDNAEIHCREARGLDADGRGRRQGRGGGEAPRLARPGSMLDETLEYSHDIAEEFWTVEKALNEQRKSQMRFPFIRGARVRALNVVTEAGPSEPPDRSKTIKDNCPLGFFSFLD